MQQMDKENILHVGLCGPLPPPYGGMANQLNQLYQLLIQEGIQVSLVQTNVLCPYKIIQKIKGLRALFCLISYVQHIWNLAGKVHVIHVLSNSGWSWQLFSAPVLWIGWLRNTPVIINYRGGEARTYFNDSIKWVLPSINKASAVIVPSGYLKAVFSDFGIESAIIPNIINLERFHVKSTCRQMNPLRPHLIITRNLEAIYGIVTAINAIALLRKTVPDVLLSIAGSGPQLKELQQLIIKENLQQNVSFTGKLTVEEITDLYLSSDIMLNPTTVDNMPNSILEAMACGVPVVTTEVGGIPYLVKHEETALLTEVNNPIAMVMQISRLLNEPDLYRTLSENGVRDVQQYNWQDIKQSWLALYEAQRGLAELKGSKAI